MANTFDVTGFTEEQRRRFGAAAALAPVESRITPTVTSDDLKPEPSPKLPSESQFPPRTSGTELGSIPSAYAEFFSSITAQMNEDKRELEKRSKEQDDVASQMRALLGETGEIEQTRELETEAGLPERRKELRGIMNQLLALSAAQAAIPLQIQEEFEGSGATLAGVAPIERGRLRENAIKALTLSAVGQALQGDIQLAEDTIKQSIDIQFEREERKLKILDFTFKANEGLLSRVDARMTTAMGWMLDLNKVIVEERRQEKTAIADIFGALVKTGTASRELLSSVLSSGSSEEALAKATPSLSDSAKEEVERKKTQQNFENAIAEGQLSLGRQRLQFEKDKALAELRGQGGLESKDVGEVTSHIKANRELLDMASEYRNLVAEYGFESVIGSAEVRGKMRSLRGQILDANRRATGAGALDAGVFANAESVFGVEPTGFDPTGGRALAIIASLDTAIGMTKNKILIDKAIIGTNSWLPRLYTVNELKELGFIKDEEGEEASVNMQSDSPAFYYSGEPSF